MFQKKKFFFLKKDKKNDLINICKIKDTSFFKNNFITNVVNNFTFTFFFKTLLKYFKHLFKFNVNLIIKSLSVNFFFKKILILIKRPIFLKKLVFKDNLKVFLLYTYISFFFKKPFFLLSFLKKNFWNKHTDLIKKLISSVRLFFKKFNKLFIKLFFLKGFGFFFKGKIGVYGNSRKKRILLKFGRLSSTNETLNSSFSVINFINKSGLTKSSFFIFF